MIGTGKTVQTACVQGSYTDQTGQSACLGCPRGTTNTGTGNSSCSTNCMAITNLATWQLPVWSETNTISVATCLVESCNACVKGTGVATCEYNMDNNMCNYSGTCSDGYNTPAVDSNTITCTPNGYVVTYKAGDGGNGNDVTQNVTFDANFTTKQSDTFNKQNARFISWLPSVGAYEAANTSYKYTTVGNITLTALWECNPGYGYNSTTHSCVACGDGYYKANYGNAECDAASKGYYVAGNAQTGQIACVQGSYTSEVAQSACVACNKGKTNVDTANDSCDTDCAPISNLSTWQQPAWSFETNTMTVGTCLVESCDVCTTSVGVAWCQYDMIGNTCNYSGDCSPGYNTPVFDGSYLSCTPDEYTVTYKAGDGGDGTDYVVHVVFDATFDTKAADFYHKQNATFAGWEPSAGSYTDPSTTYTYKTVDDITLTALWNCNPGYGYNSTTHNCDPCLAGTYKASLDNTACKIANKGYFVAGVTQTYQVACIQGSYASETGQSACLPCDVGKTNTGTGNDSCDTDCQEIVNLATWKRPIWQLDNTISVATCLVESCNECVRGTGVATCEYNMDNNMCNYSGTCKPGYNTPVPDSYTILCTPNEYTVTYKAGDGGDGNDVIQSVTFDADFTTNPSDTFSKQNATFMGWSPSAGAYVLADETYQYVTVGNVTLTALWKCNVGYTLNTTTRNCELCAKGLYKPFLGNEACEVCPPNYYCDGTLGVLGDGSTMCETDTAPDKDAFTNWAFAPEGSDEKEDCFTQCEERDVNYGRAYPDNATENWPTVCSFTGLSETGNPCKIEELAQNKCIEAACHSNFEMKNGICTLCNRDFATSYESYGNCIVAMCDLGYHPYGDSCVGDDYDCTDSIPNATSARVSWLSTTKAFDICRVESCEDGYHVSSNACVPDEQVCAVPHGIGIQTWNFDEKKWNPCEATSCDAGYTNDNSEKKKQTEQCSECKNKYVNGEQAVSSYVQGCEIASCMYQGEKYALDGDECMPICVDRPGDDTVVSLVWNSVTEKCERTCKPGYVPW